MKNVNHRDTAAQRYFNKGALRFSLCRCVSVVKVIT